jgi:hypothetical protein
MYIETGMRGIKPSKPFETLIRLDGYPYPQQGSRVLPGRGKGTEKIPGGYPGRTLATDLLVVTTVVYVALH